MSVVYFGGKLYVRYRAFAFKQSFFAMSKSYFATRRQKLSEAAFDLAVDG